MSDRKSLLAKRPERPPYAKYAFMNAYNLSLLTASMAVAVGTQSLWVGALGLGLEALWMLFAPDSKVLRRVWFDKYHEKVLEHERLQELNVKFAMLPPQDAERCRGLQTTRDHILYLAKDNPSLTVGMLRAELEKLDKLVFDFLDLASLCNRYAHYLYSIDIQGIEQEIARYEAQLGHLEKGDARRTIAQKNLAVLGRRRDMYAEISRDLQAARGQLDLIENTFRLLADQILTMRSPSELSHQLDELMDGVEAIRTTQRETEKIMMNLDREAVRT